MKRRDFIKAGTALTVMTMAAPSMIPAEAATDKIAPIADDKSLRVASCQFPVSGNISENAQYIKNFMIEASKLGAHLLHTSEACLSGYPSVDIPSFAGLDWNSLRRETAALRKLATDLGIWLVLGSVHYLDENTKPTNCLYLINPEGKIVNRYDKSFCTEADQQHYSSGDRLVTCDIHGVKIGLAICYDICWPQLYIGYREQGATVMLHSFHNARGVGPNCLDQLNVREAATRCADNHMWAICNNSSQPYSHWGSFVARPDSSILKQLRINHSGMLVHDFPDGLSEGGWIHNPQPMRKRDDEIMSWGTVAKHPRKDNGQAEP